MSWLGWALFVVAMLTVFVLWDLVFCGGRRCRDLTDRDRASLTEVTITNETDVKASECAAQDTSSAVDQRRGER